MFMFNEGIRSEVKAADTGLSTKEFWDDYVSVSQGFKESPELYREALKGLEKTIRKKLVSSDGHFQVVNEAEGDFFCLALKGTPANFLHKEDAEYCVQALNSVLPKEDYYFVYKEDPGYSIEILNSVLSK